MTYKQLATCVLAASVAFAPFTASAHGWHGGRGIGLFAAGAAVVGVTAAIVSAPFVAINNAVAQPYYAGPPAYYPSQSVYPQQAYYNPAPAYYAPPVYYAPRPQYYAPAYYSYR